MPMTLAQVKRAVDEGETVHWSNTGYVVIEDSLGEYLVVCTRNEYTTGLIPKDAEKCFVRGTHCPTCGQGLRGES